MSFYDPIEYHDFPRGYLHNDAMSREQQLNWLDDLAHRDPRWTDSESTVRRLAVEIQDKLHKSGREELVAVAIPRYDRNGYAGMTFETVRFVLTRLGGMEELFLIEEILRRTMGLR